MAEEGGERENLKQIKDEEKKQEIEVRMSSIRHCHIIGL